MGQMICQMKLVLILLIRRKNNMFKAKMVESIMAHIEEQEKRERELEAMENIADTLVTGVSVVAFSVLAAIAIKFDI
jgi:hypothetical protein